jgi:hypothetical protein
MDSYYEILLSKGATENHLNNQIKNDRSFLCVCGALRNVKTNGILKITCGKKECHPRFGVLRPEHSAKMKVVMVGNSSLFQKGRKNEHINSLDFKKTWLINKNFEIDRMTNSEIEQLFKIEKTRNILKTRESKISHILRMFAKYNEECVSKECLEKMTNEEIDHFVYRARSIKTLNEVTLKGLGDNRRHKRELISGLTYNLSGREWIKTKSSYEGNYIRWFENNRIMWDYETIVLSGQTTKYLPDFFFIYDGKKYLLETKGYIQDKQRYYEDKISLGMEYAKNNNCTFLFTYRPMPKSIKWLTEQKVEETYK